MSRAWTRRPARRVVGLLLATLVGGCGVRHAADGAASPSEVAALTEQPDPCPGVSAIDLGAPVAGGPTARFSLAADSTVWLSAQGFQHGGIFDPEVWRTRIDIGPQDALPVYSEQRSTVSNSEVAVDVIEETWSRVELDAGDHWLWATSGGSILLKSCDGGTITAVEPVHR